jgi:hypothetical protein
VIFKAADFFHAGSEAYIEVKINEAMKKFLKLQLLPS